MPFIRVHGHQLALVHGSRRGGTVVQEVLFTLYSRAEAREAIGLGSENGARYFAHLLESQFPMLKFEWETLRAQVAEHLDHLPETYDHGAVRLRRDFRAALAAFTRQILLADPQTLDVDAELLREHEPELQYIEQQLSWRRRMAREAKPSEWSRDNPFFWRRASHLRDVPPDAHEHLAELFDRREFAALVPHAQLLVEAFPTFADGFNMLGLVAMELDDLPTATRHFEATVAVGRSLLPGRVPKGHWWLDLSTRPYMRGLGNLALALNRAGRYDEALVACDELARCERGDVVAARRAAIFLNQDRLAESAEIVAPLVEFEASEAFVLAFALIGLGRAVEARPQLVRAIAHWPRTARRLVGLTQKAAKTRREQEDDDVYRNLTLDLHAWLARTAPSGLDPLRDLVRHPRIATLAAEVMQLEAAEAAGRAHDTTGFDRLRELRTTASAEQFVTLLDAAGVQRKAPRGGRA